jgi:hypothetical protein
MNTTAKKNGDSNQLKRQLQIRELESARPARVLHHRGLQTSELLGALSAPFFFI